jgi:hypothetical protein
MMRENVLALLAFKSHSGDKDRHAKSWSYIFTSLTCCFTCRKNETPPAAKYWGTIDDVLRCAQNVER